MTAHTVRVSVPASFAMSASLYSQATQERDERYIEAASSDLLSFAFRIMERVFQDALGKP